MGRWKAACLLLAMSCGLVGCGQNKTPEVSSVSIGKEGGITHQIVGSFEQNNYQLESLETLAVDRVAEYQDYSQFNNREFYIGSLEEADAQGYYLDSVAFISADGKPTEIGDVEEWDGKQIVVVETKSGEDLLVNTYGKVLYINQSATSNLDISFSGKTGAYISHPMAEEGGMDESTLSYIVFEK